MDTGSACAQTPTMMGIERPSVPEFDPRMHEALTDLHAYVLILDAEWRRSSCGELREELDALRAALAALRHCLDPAGHYL